MYTTYACGYRRANTPSPTFHHTPTPTHTPAYTQIESYTYLTHEDAAHQGGDLAHFWGPNTALGWAVENIGDLDGACCCFFFLSLSGASGGGRGGKAGMEWPPIESNDTICVL